MIAEIVVYFGNGTGGRPQHRADFLLIRRLAQAGIEAVPEFRGTPQNSGFFLSCYRDDSNVPKRRRILHPAQIHFQLIKALIVLLRRQPDNLVFRNQ